MTITEDVARALCAAEFPDVSAQYAWNVQFDDGKNEYRAQADAAIAAARPIIRAELFDELIAVSATRLGGEHMNFLRAQQRKEDDRD